MLNIVTSLQHFTLIIASGLSISITRREGGEEEEEKEEEEEDEKEERCEREVRKRR